MKAQATDGFKRLLQLFTVLFLLMNIGHFSPVNAQALTKRYTTTDGTFSFKLPADWTATETDNPPLLIVSSENNGSENGEGIRIQIFPPSAFFDRVGLDRLTPTDAVKSFSKQYPPDEEPETFTIGSYRAARKLIYTGNSLLIIGVQLKKEQFVLLLASNEVNNPEAFEPTIFEIIKTMRFTGTIPKVLTAQHIEPNLIPGQYFHSTFEISPDRKLVAISTERVLFVAEIATFKVIAQFSHDKNVQEFTWSPDNKKILSVAGDAGYIWDVATQKELFRIRATSSPNWKSAHWSRNGGHILTTSGVWDDQTGKQLISFPVGAGIHGVSWDAYEQHIVSWGDRGVNVLNGTTGDAEQVLVTSPDSQAALFDNNIMVMKRFDTTLEGRVAYGSKSNKWYSLTHKEEIGSIFLNQKGSRLIAANGDAIYLWNMSNGTLITRNNWLPSVWGARWNKDGTRFMFWSMHGGAFIADGQTGNALVSMFHTDTYPGGVINMDWLDENHVLSMDDNGRIYIWNADGSVQKH